MDLVAKIEIRQSRITAYASTDVNRLKSELAEYKLVGDERALGDFLLDLNPIEVHITDYELSFLSKVMQKHIETLR